MTDRAYDPDLAPLIPLLPIETNWGDLDGARAQMEEMIRWISPPEPEDSPIEWTDRVVPGPEDAPELTLRVYRHADSEDVVRPAILYIHGGGFCFGSLESEHMVAFGAALAADAVVVSVGYRLAPEHPFPAGLEDCYAGLQWTAANAAELGVDPAYIAVAGSSAGGGLSAALALLARDRGGPVLCFQFLGIPELDHRLETASMKSFADTPLWNRPSAIESWKCYLGEASGEVSPYASPAIAKDLSGLPPAYVSTMEFDPLRDEGIEYALRLLQHGVSVELHQYPGTFHGSHFFANADVSKRTIEEMNRVLYQALRP